MPGQDRTGPAGTGPMTGRGRGPCAGNNIPGCATGRRGKGRGMSRGMGFRNRFFAGWGNAPQAPHPISKEDQVAALKAQQTRIQQQIDTLEGQDGP